MGGDHPYLSPSKPKNNGGGGNHGGEGTIAIVDNEGTIIETIQGATPDNGRGFNF